MKPLIFLFGVGVLFIFLMFKDAGKEGNIPIVAFTVAFGVIAFIFAVDWWRHPETYRKKKKE